MKRISNPKDNILAQHLIEIIESRRDLDRREAELKEYFKTKYDGEEVLKLNDILITLTEKERSNIDKLAVLAFLGVEKFKECETVSIYTQIDVRRI